MKSEFERDSIPVVTIIEAGAEAREQFGHAYGSQKLQLSSEALAALSDGKQLAIDIMDGEYVLFISADQET